MHVLLAVQDLGDVLHRGRWILDAFAVEADGASIFDLTPTTEASARRALAAGSEALLRRLGSAARVKGCRVGATTRDGVHVDEHRLAVVARAVAGVVAAVGPIAGIVCSAAAAGTDPGSCGYDGHESEPCS